MPINNASEEKKCVTADGKNLNSVGSTSFTLRLREKVFEIDATVIDNLQWDVILGIDWITKSTPWAAIMSKIGFDSDKTEINTIKEETKETEITEEETEETEENVKKEEKRQKRM